MSKTYQISKKVVKIGAFICGCICSGAAFDMSVKQLTDAEFAVKKLFTKKAKNDGDIPDSEVFE